MRRRSRLLSCSVETRGTWNEHNLKLTGIEIETLQDGGVHLRQQKFVDQCELISLSQRRSRADTDKLTPGESTQLRIGWEIRLVRISV